MIFVLCLKSSDLIIIYLVIMDVHRIYYKHYTRMKRNKFYFNEHNIYLSPSQNNANHSYSSTPSFCNNN